MRLVYKFQLRKCNVNIVHHTMRVVNFRSNELEFDDTKKISEANIGRNTY